MNFLDAHPKAAAIVAFWREDGQFVPHLWREKLCGTDGDIMAAASVPDHLSAEDYIIGMELLGFRFDLGEIGGQPALYTSNPDTIPTTWHRHALRLRASFDGPQRTRQAIDFLLERDRSSENPAQSFDKVVD